MGMKLMSDKGLQNCESWLRIAKQSHNKKIVIIATGYAVHYYFKELENVDR